MRLRLRSLLFPLYAATLIAPLFVWRDWWSREAYAETATVTQFLGFAVMFVAAWAFRDRLRLPMNAASITAAAFFSWCALTIFWTIDVSDTVSGLTAFVTFAIAICLFWNMPKELRSESFLVTALVLFAGLLALYLYLPFHDRTLGGITPNLLAHTAILAVFCLYLSNRYLAVGLTLAIVVILLTQARAALISLAAFLLFFHLLLPLFRKLQARWLALSLLTLATLGAGLVGQVLMPIVTRSVTEVAGVTSASRVGGDFSGRTAMWQAGLAYLDRRPLTGYGFKTRTSGDLLSGPSFSAHSGAINVALDVGIIGALLFIAWYMASLYRCFETSERYDQRSLAVCAAFLVANVPLLVIEPNYISFGHPTAFALLLSLFSPIALRPQRMRRAAMRIGFDRLARPGATASRGYGLSAVRGN